jgi:hypothetical protein
MPRLEMLPSDVFGWYDEFELNYLVNCEGHDHRVFQNAAFNELCQILLVCYGLRRAALPFSWNNSPETTWSKYPALQAFIEERVRIFHPNIRIDGQKDSHYRFVYDSSKLNPDEIAEIKVGSHNNDKIGNILGMGVVVEDYDDKLVSACSIVVVNVTILKEEKETITCNLVHCNTDCKDDSNAEVFLLQMQAMVDSANELFRNLLLNPGKAPSSPSYRLGDSPFKAQRKWQRAVELNGITVLRFV